MKVVAFNGSARKDGNTAILLREVLGVLGRDGIETELLQLGGEKVHGCRACLKCAETRDGRCHGVSDFVTVCIDKMYEADGILVGSPVYFGDVSPETKALVDRAGYASRSSGRSLRRKVGAGVVAVRRAGATHALESINNLFLPNEMIVPGSSYWNVGFGKAPGEVSSDEEGMATMRALGENMAWLLGKLA